MKFQIAHTLNRNIVADDIVVNLVRILCFSGGLFVFGLSLWKLLRLDLTEAQIFFGILLSSISAMLLIFLGLLLPHAIKPKSA